MWIALDNILVKDAEKTLGVSKGPLHTKKETWWWSNETKKAVKAKSKAYKDWTTCDSSREAEKSQFRDIYLKCRKEVKRKLAQAKAVAAEKFYQELEDQTADKRSSWQEKPKDNARIYKIAAQRRRNAQEIPAPKYIENSQGVLLVEDAAICNRMREYFDELLNEEFPRKDFHAIDINNSDIADFSMEEVEKAMMQMKRGKVVGPDKIPVEF